MPNLRVAPDSWLHVLTFVLTNIRVYLEEMSCCIGRVLKGAWRDVFSKSQRHDANHNSHDANG